MSFTEAHRGVWRAAGETIAGFFNRILIGDLGMAGGIR